MAHIRRLVSREPMVLVSVALMLAIGIGANAAVFAVAYAVIFRPLPVADQDRLILMWERDPARNVSLWEVSHRDYLDWQAESASFAGLAALGTVNWPSRIMKEDGPAVLPFAAVSGNFFDVLGVRPAHGTAFTMADDRRGAHGPVVISHRTWQTHFGGHPQIVGRAVMIDPGDGLRAYTVVGVMGEDFEYPARAAMWLPVSPVLAGASARAGFDTLEARGLGVLYVVGRLKPGVTQSAAQAEMDAVVGRLTRGASSERGRLAVLTPLPTHIFGQVRPALLLLLAGVGLVLALVCANVIGLLLTRLAGRRRRLAICAALGAEPRHFLRQSLAEGAAFAVCGGIAALLVATWSLPILLAFVPEDVPRLADVSTRRPAVLVFTLAIGSACALVCGLAPAAAYLWRRPLNILRAGDQGSRPGSTGRNLLVVAQVALSVVLLVAAGLTARSFVAIRGVNLGFDPERVVTVDVRAPAEQYADDDVNRLFYAAALERIRALPGVTGVAGIFLRPFELGPIGSDVGVIVEGQDPKSRASWQKFPGLNSEAVSTDYFRVMRIPLVSGRLFTEADRPGAPAVVVVSRSAAARLWPGQNALGRKIMTSEDRNLSSWLTVVGVVEDVRYRGIDDPRLDLYWPYLQSRDGVQHVMLKLAAGATVDLSRVRAAVRAVAPGAIVDALRPMTEVVGREYAPWRFTAVLFSLLALLGVTLVVLGLYATLTAQVTDRTREIGIRLALGAQRRQVVGLIVRRVAALVGCGAAAGLFASFLSLRAIARLLFGVTPTDAITYISVGSVLVGVSIVAAARPARRAAAVDPLVALKEE